MSTHTLNSAEAEVGKRTDGLKIERGIPVPAGRPGWARLLRSLKVGESVLFPPQHKSTTVRKRAAQSLGSGNYACKQVDGGTRVWRTR